MSNAAADSVGPAVSPALLIALALACVSCIAAFFMQRCAPSVTSAQNAKYSQVLIIHFITNTFCRHRLDARSQQPSHPSRAVSPVRSAPPRVREAAAVTAKALSTKDIIKNVITPPMSPSSPVATSPAAAVMLSPRLRTPASHALSPPPPRSSSPKSMKSAKKQTPHKAQAGILGVFKADFIVEEKKDKDGVLYRIRLPGAPLLLALLIVSLCAPNHRSPSVLLTFRLQGGPAMALMTTRGSERAMLLMSGPPPCVLARIMTCDARRFCRTSSMISFKRSSNASNLREQRLHLVNSCAAIPCIAAQQSLASAVKGAAHRLQQPEPAQGARPAQPLRACRCTLGLHAPTLLSERSQVAE